jgi:hypothetical protein
VYSSASGYGPVSSSYEHGSKMLKNDQFLKKKSCTQFVSLSVSESMTQSVNYIFKQFFICNSARNALKSVFVYGILYCLLLV